MENTLPNIKLLNGSQALVGHLCYNKFVDHYENNHIESVFDLEDKDIKINRFAFVDFTRVFYLEVDRRIYLSEK